MLLLAMFMRVAFDNVCEIIDDLLEVQRGVLCLQEVGSWPDAAAEELSIKAWTAQHTAGSPSAILVPSEFEGQLRWTGSHSMHSQVLLGHIGIISSYLPDSWKPLCLIAAALSELQ